MLWLIADFCDAIDEGHVTLLALLDISTVVDHNIWLTRLRTSDEIVGQPLQWFHSFLNKQTEGGNWLRHISMAPIPYTIWFLVCFITGLRI